MSVVNRSEHSDEMFEVAPDLPPCGLNTNASRSWIDIYDLRGKRLNGFCAIQSSDGLGNLWFALPTAQAPVESVYVVIRDRRLNKELRSDPISISVP